MCAAGNDAPPFPPLWARAGVGGLQSKRGFKAGALSPKMNRPLKKISQVIEIIYRKKCPTVGHHGIG